MVEEWPGNPFFLIISTAAGDRVGIDLDEPGWMTTFAAYMREPGRWDLCLKATAAPVLVIAVLPGEQPYYTARHVGVVGSAGGNEFVAYGLGKKRLDGHVDRLWILPDGTVCAGDDLEELAMGILNEMGPR